MKNITAFCDDEEGEDDTQAQSCWVLTGMEKLWGHAWKMNKI
jgi:hypothetical protein